MALPMTRTDLSQDVVTYTNPVWQLIAFAVAALAFVGWIFRASFAADAVIVTICGCAYFLIFRNRLRRKIVVSERELISVPTSGSPVTIPFADVAKVKRTTTLWSGGRYEQEIEAIEFSMVNGDQFVIGLDFRQREDILRDVSRRVGQNVADAGRPSAGGPRRE